MIDDQEKCRRLVNRWNLAASHAGYKGSEYVDEPEHVFEEVKDLKDKFGHTMKERTELRRGIMKVFGSLSSRPRTEDEEWVLDILRDTLLEADRYSQLRIMGSE
jgi:hypothetical protein